MEPILRIKNIEKYYGNKSCLTKAIDDISFTVEEGEVVAIMGASGSGKTTLLNCISTIDKVTAGNIYLEDTDVTALKGKNSTNSVVTSWDLSSRISIFLIHFQDMKI